MELVYLYYTAKGKQPRYILLLLLGQENGKYYGLATDQVSDSERSHIVAQAPKLAGLSLGRRVDWLRDNCPNAFRNSYRTINSSNATIISRHPITAK